MRALFTFLLIACGNGALVVADGCKRLAQRMVANDLNRRQDRQ